MSGYGPWSVPRGASPPPAISKRRNRAGSRAAAIAHASALVPGPDLHLAELPAVQDRYVTPVVEDPFVVPLSEKADLVVGVTDTMASVEGIKVAHAYLRFWETEKYLVSSQGHEIHQRLVESGGGMDATAVGETETQRRSYPQSTGDYRTGGYEVVREFDLPGNAGRIAEEAVALLSRRPAPAGKRTSSSNRASWPCRSMSRWAMPSNSTGSWDGRRRLRAPRFSTSGNWAASVMAPS